MPRRPTAPAALVAALALAALASAAVGERGLGAQLFNAGAAPVTVGPRPRGVAGLDAAACVPCHAEIVAEWSSSLHARAWSDPVFQSAYRVEPMAFCRNCHAPLNDHRDPSPTSVAALEGVSCSFCHVRAGHVLGTHGDPDRRAPHPTLAVRSLSESPFCGGCHQFNFPGEGARGSRREVFATDEPMQDTLHEWEDSQSAREGVHCQGCHMPLGRTREGRSYRRHTFPGSRDAELLRSAVDVSVTATREGEMVRIRTIVTPRALGHSFPTGDLFRRVELVASVEGAHGSERRLGYAREFSNNLSRDPHGALTFVRRQSSDTRVPAAGMGAPTARELVLRAPVGTRVIWSLDHLLMPTPLAASLGIGTPLNRAVVTSGTTEIEALP